MSLRAAAVDAARGALARAVADLADAQRARGEAAEIWQRRVEESATGPWSSVGDFEASRAHLESLHRRLLAAHEVEARAREECDRRRDAVTEANKELKKLETWRDSLAAEELEEARVADRVATDELAARLTRDG